MPPTTAKTTTATRPWSVDETTAPQRRNSTVSWLTNAAYTFFPSIFFSNIPHSWIIFYLLFPLVLFFRFRPINCVDFAKQVLFLFAWLVQYFMSSALFVSFLSPCYYKLCTTRRMKTQFVDHSVHNNTRDTHTGAARRRTSKWNKSLLL